MPGTKRALVIGCNYPGTEAELHGCVNDAHAISNMLVEHFGFNKKDITVLVDTEDPKPTGKEIKKQMKKHVEASEAGDVLFFHFSGHGTQVPDKGKSKGEADGLDEAICPTDMNLICDDDLHTILEPLSPKVKFTFITDCCHSGSMTDQPRQQISGDKDPDAPDVDDGDDRELLGSFFKGDEGGKGKHAPKNRSLETDMLTSMLGKKLGGGAMDASSIHGMLAQGFGDDASKKSKKKTGMITSALDSYSQGDGQYAEQAGMVSDLMGKVGLGDRDADGNGGHGKHGGKHGGHGKHGGDGGKRAGHGDGGSGVAGVPGVSGGSGGGGKDSEHKKNVAEGVLVTGCQSEETSADACPSGNPKKAFGALSNALTTTVAQLKKKNPDAKITNYLIVQQVRKTLLKAGYEQNPCLECNGKNVKQPFICD